MPRLARSLAWIVTAVVVLTPRTVSACGAAYPGGPVMCEFPRAPASTATAVAPVAAPFVRLSASYAFTSTTLLFGGGRRADLTRHAAFASVQLPLAKTLTLQLGAGGIAGGHLVHGAARDELGPGQAVFVGGAWRMTDGRGAAPVVQLTATASATHAITATDERGTRTDGSTAAGARRSTPRFNAFDLRVGVIVSKTFLDVVTPYLVARAFGGPVSWRLDGEAVTGTDLYKYQAGGGLSIALGRHLDLFAEGIPLGERGVAAGLGSTF